MDSIPVHVETSDPRLGEALRQHFRFDPRFRLVDAKDGFGVLIAPVRDLSPAACSQYVSRGWQVIVLAAVARAEERERYRAAGAACYLEMDVTPGILRTAAYDAARPEIFGISAM